MNKRLSKRFTYLPQARLEAQSSSQSIQLRDVSQSGIQFFSNALIKNNTPIVITWQDQAIGKVNPFVMVVRKIDQPGVGAFRYNYGSQFFNLRQETKGVIDKLLLQTQDQESHDNKALVEKITVDAMLKIIEDGRSFIQDLLKGNDSSKLFIRFTRDLKDYEKRSFSQTTEDAQMTQKLTMHNFHCRLLNIAIPLVPKAHQSGFDLYKATVKKIETVSDIVVEAKKNFHASKEVQESANRLYYDKLELLRSFVTTYEKSSTLETQSEDIKKIVSEFRQVTAPLKKTPRN